MSSSLISGARLEPPRIRIRQPKQAQSIGPGRGSAAAQAAPEPSRIASRRVGGREGEAKWTRGPKSAVRPKLLSYDRYKGETNERIDRDFYQHRAIDDCRLGGLADVEREAFPFVAFLLQCNQAPGPALV